MPSKSRRIRRIVGALVLVAVIGTLGDLALRPAPAPPIVGMVRTTEIKIAPEVSGRIAALPVRAGDHVAAGTVIATLSNPELSASVGEARAAVGQSRAARDHVYAGVRQEEVDIAAREVDKATADLTLAEEQFRRTSAVTGAGYSSKQNLDNAQAAVAAARANLVQMQSEFAAAQHGPTAEDRASADAAVAAAEASLAVAGAAGGKTATSGARRRRREDGRRRARRSHRARPDRAHHHRDGRALVQLQCPGGRLARHGYRHLPDADDVRRARRFRPRSRSCAASAISPPGARRAPSAITISTPSPFVPIPVVRSTDSSPA